MKKWNCFETYVGEEIYRQQFLRGSINSKENTGWKWNTQRIKLEVSHKNQSLWFKWLGLPSNNVNFTTWCSPALASQWHNIFVTHCCKCCSLPLPSSPSSWERSKGKKIWLAGESWISFPHLCQPRLGFSTQLLDIGGKIKGTNQMHPVLIQKTSNLKTSFDIEKDLDSISGTLE